MRTAVSDQSSGNSQASCSNTTRSGFPSRAGSTIRASRGPQATSS